MDFEVHPNRIFRSTDKQFKVHHTSLICDVDDIHSRSLTPPPPSFTTSDHSTSRRNSLQTNSSNYQYVDESPAEVARRREIRRLQVESPLYNMANGDEEKFVAMKESADYRESGLKKLKSNSWESIARWEKENEFLFALIEDECDWLTRLFPDESITPSTFFNDLEDGVALCKLAELCQRYAENYAKEHKKVVPMFPIYIHPRKKCQGRLGNFMRRENVELFLKWCRIQNLPESLLFETNDVVERTEENGMRENAREIVLCLMEVARLGVKFGVAPPQLILLEKEIEMEEQMDNSSADGSISPTSVDSGFDTTDSFQYNTSLNVDNLHDGDNDLTNKIEAYYSGDNSSVSKSKDKKDKRKRSVSRNKKGSESRKNSNAEFPKTELHNKVKELTETYDVLKITRLKEGKYIILGKVMFVRLLNGHCLVRIGGGWDTLEHYLITHINKVAPDNFGEETPTRNSNHNRSQATPASSSNLKITNKNFLAKSTPNLFKIDDEELSLEDKEEKLSEGERRSKTPSKDRYFEEKRLRKSDDRKISKAILKVQANVVGLKKAASLDWTHLREHELIERNFEAGFENEKPSSTHTNNQSNQFSPAIMADIDIAITEDTNNNSALDVVDSSVVAIEEKTEKLTKKTEDTTSTKTKKTTKSATTTNKTKSKSTTTTTTGVRATKIPPTTTTTTRNVRPTTNAKLSSTPSNSSSRSVKSPPTTAKITKKTTANRSTTAGGNTTAKPKTTTSSATTKPKPTTSSATTKPKPTTSSATTKPKPTTSSATTKPKPTTSLAAKPKPTTSSAAAKPATTTTSKTTTRTTPKTTTPKSTPGVKPATSKTTGARSTTTTQPAKKPAVSKPLDTAAKKATRTPLKSTIKPTTATTNAASPSKPPSNRTGVKAPSKPTSATTPKKTTKTTPASSANKASDPKKPVKKTTSSSTTASNKLKTKTSSLSSTTKTTKTKTATTTKTAKTEKVQEDKNVEKVEKLENIDTEKVEKMKDELIEEISDKDPMNVPTAQEEECEGPVRSSTPQEILQEQPEYSTMNDPMLEMPEQEDQQNALIKDLQETSQGVQDTSQDDLQEPQQIPSQEQQENLQNSIIESGKDAFEYTKESEHEPFQVQGECALDQTQEKSVQDQFQEQGESAQHEFESQEESVQDAFQNQGEAIEDQFQNQGESAQDPFQNQGDSTQDTFQNQGESAQDPFQNQGESAQDPFQNQEESNQYPFQQLSPEPVSKNIEDPFQQVTQEPFLQSTQEPFEQPTPEPCLKEPENLSDDYTQSTSDVLGDFTQEEKMDNSLEQLDLEMCVSDTAQTKEVVFVVNDVKVVQSPETESQDKVESLIIESVDQTNTDENTALNNNGLSENETSQNDTETREITNSSFTVIAHDEVKEYDSDNEILDEQKQNNDSEMLDLSKINEMEPPNDADLYCVTPLVSSRLDDVSPFFGASPAKQSYNQEHETKANEGVSLKDDVQYFDDIPDNSINEQNKEDPAISQTSNIPDTISFVEVPEDQSSPPDDVLEDVGDEQQMNSEISLDNNDESEEAGNDQMEGGDDQMEGAREQVEEDIQAEQIEEQHQQSEEFNKQFEDEKLADTQQEVIVTEAWKQPQQEEPSNDNDLKIAADNVMQNPYIEDDINNNSDGDLFVRSHVKYEELTSNEDLESDIKEEITPTKNVEGDVKYGDNVQNPIKVSEDISDESDKEEESEGDSPNHCVMYFDNQNKSVTNIFDNEYNQEVDELVKGQNIMSSDGIRAEISVDETLDFV